LIALETSNATADTHSFVGWQKEPSINGIVLGQIGVLAEMGLGRELGVNSHVLYRRI
jgi:hypothetical protein